MYQGMAKGRGKYTPMCLGMVFRVEENIHPKVDVDASMGEFWSSEFFSACLREGEEGRGRGGAESVNDLGEALTMALQKPVLSFVIKKLVDLFKVKQYI